MISPVTRFRRGQSERPTLNEGKTEHESSNQRDTKRRTFVKTKIRPSEKERRTIERQRQRNVVQKSPSAGARSVLSEDYREESKTAPVEGLVEYWGQLFSKTSVEDKRPVSHNSETLYDLEFPITCDEVDFAIRGLRDIAPGHDRLKKHHIEGIKNIRLCVPYVTVAVDRLASISVQNRNGYLYSKYNRSHQTK